MKRNLLDINLQVDFLREGKSYIAYSPALDLATSGRTVKEAKESFAEAAQLFFETILENGTYSEVLHNLGWSANKRGGKMSPPVIVSRETLSVA